MSKILIVDDDMINRKLLNVLLKKMDMKQLKREMEWKL